MTEKQNQPSRVPDVLVWEIAADDVAASVAFYVSVLGFKVSADAKDESGALFWAEVELGAVHIMMQRRTLLASEFGVDAQEFRRSCVVLRFGHQDLLAFYTVLSKSPDVRIARDITRTEYGTVELSLFDPDGNVVVLSAAS